MKKAKKVVLPDVFVLLCDDGAGGFMVAASTVFPDVAANLRAHKEASDRVVRYTPKGKP